MGVILVFIGSLLLYAKSKHFPEFLNFVGIRARQKPVLTRAVAYIAFLLSILIFTVQFDFATALVIFMITVMLMNDIRKCCVCGKISKEHNLVCVESGFQHVSTVSKC